MKRFRLEGDPHEAEMVECEFGEFVKLEDVNMTNNENMSPLNEQSLEVLSGIKHLIQTYELDEIIALIDETLNNQRTSK
jgi:hypothetical protein